jgi:hypothetical protein
MMQHGSGVLLPLHHGTEQQPTPPPPLPPDAPQHMRDIEAGLVARVEASKRQRLLKPGERIIGCPCCRTDVVQAKRGDWRCPCGAKGGQFAGGRLYMTEHPDTTQGKLAAARLAGHG